MDLLQDIYEHPAYGKFRKEVIMRLKIKVLDLLNELKSLIADHNLTERIVTLAIGEHYKECPCAYYPYDMVDTCVCCRVDLKHAQICTLLDDIHLLQGGWVKQLKSCVSIRDGAEP